VMETDQMPPHLLSLLAQAGKAQETADNALAQAQQAQDIADKIAAFAERELEQYRQGLGGDYLILENDEPMRTLYGFGVNYPQHRPTVAEMALAHIRWAEPHEVENGT
jgi:hypothetical protein